MAKQTKRRSCTNIRLSLPHDDHERLQQLQAQLQAELGVSKVSQTDAIKRAILEAVNIRETAKLASLMS